MGQPPVFSNRSESDDRPMLATQGTAATPSLVSVRNRTGDGGRRSIPGKPENLRIQKINRENQIKKKIKKIKSINEIERIEKTITYKISE